MSGARYLSTPRQVYDQNQTLVWKWDSQEPFGNDTPNGDPGNTGSTFDLPLRLPGQVNDKETGLSYNYLRDCYDPVTGRFCQSDPIGLGGGLNPYLYSRAAPLLYVDPLGLFNYWKGAAAAGNALLAGGNLAIGLAEITGGTAAAGSGVGVVASVGAYTLAGWRLLAAYNAARRSIQLIKEASRECSSEGSVKNLLGIVPFGTHFDDPNESFKDFLQDMQDGLTTDSGTKLIQRLSEGAYALP